MSVNNSKKVGFPCGMISGVSYGTFGIFQTMLLVAGVTENALVALPAFILTLYFGIRVLFKPRVMKEIPWKIYLLVGLQGAIGTTALNYCYTMAYSSGMPVGVVSIVAFCNVLVVMVLSHFVLKYKFTLAKIIAMVVAVFGVSLVIGLIGGGANVGVYTALGIMWTLFIPIFYGINVVINAYALAKGTDSDAALLIAQGASIIVVFIFMIHPVDLFTGLMAGTGSTFWLALIGFCVIPHIICYAMMQESLKRIDPTIYQIMMSLDPVTALILGIFVMSQAVTGLQLLGILFVLASVVFITVMDGRDAMDKEKSTTEVTTE